MPGSSSRNLLPRKKTYPVAIGTESQFTGLYRPIVSRAGGMLGLRMEKVMACDGIDAYIAHSWIDARFEGGLKDGTAEVSR